MTPRRTSTPVNRLSPWFDKFSHYMPLHLPDDQCWEWQGSINVRGYGTLQIGRKLWVTHRLSFALHNGFLPDDALICHHCDNRKCGNPRHLYAGDHQSNATDKVVRDRLNICRGEAQGSAKLTEADVRAIRAAFAAGASQKSLCEQYGVSKFPIWAIVRGKSWTHVA